MHLTCFESEIFVEVPQLFHKTGLNPFFFFFLWHITVTIHSSNKINTATAVTLQWLICYCGWYSLQELQFQLTVLYTEMLQIEAAKQTFFFFLQETLSLPEACGCGLHLTGHGELWTASVQSAASAHSHQACSRFQVGAMQFTIYSQHVCLFSSILQYFSKFLHQERKQDLAKGSVCVRIFQKLNVSWNVSGVSHSYMILKCATDNLYQVMTKIQKVSQLWKLHICYQKIHHFKWSVQNSSLVEVVNSSKFTKMSFLC